MNEMNQSVGATRPFAAASRETAAPALRRFPEYYVDAGEGAKFLGIHRRTVLQMARDSVLPAHPLGEGSRKQWRFLLSELDEWMRSRVNSARRPCSPNRRDIR
jgi:excisionase family DNA binding protein